MNILLINQDWFADEWRRAGHTVVTAGWSTHLDVRPSVPVIHIEDFINEYLNGVRPDRIVVHDNSAPISFFGLDEIDIPALFYSVDTHHHVGYHRYIANMFDVTFVAQKDYIQFFEGISDPPVWFPLWASRYIDASSEKEHGAVFVGTLDPRLNPDRVIFFEALQRQAPILCTRGEYWKIFPFAEIVVNQTVKLDLNFRVFEAMMSGAMLLTERSDNGLLDLFREGEHLVTYAKGSVEEAAEAIRSCLADIPRTRKIAEAGRAEILAKHTIEARAAVMMQHLEGLKRKDHPLRSSGAVMNLCLLSRIIEEAASELALLSVVAGLRAARRVIVRGEPITREVAASVAVLGLMYDRLANANDGMKLLELFAERYPHEVILQLTRIRNELNCGNHVRAEELVRRSFAQEPREVFQQAELLVSTMLAR